MQRIGIVFIILGVLVVSWTHGSSDSMASSSSSSSGTTGNKQSAGGWFGLGRERRQFMNTAANDILDTDTKETYERIDSQTNTSNPILDSSFPTPPPPPPPLPFGIPSTNQNSSSSLIMETLQTESQQTVQLQQEEVPTFPYQQSWGQMNPPPPLFPSYNPWDMTYGQVSPMMPPPPTSIPSYPDWSQQQQQQQQAYAPYNNEISSTWRQEEKIQNLETQLQDALQYHSQLYSQIQNLTESVTQLERITDLQLNQIQVLTERVTDAQEDIMYESQLKVEYQRNCTTLQENVTHWICLYNQMEQACINITQRFHDQEKHNILLEQKVHEKEKELQDVATRIEKARIQRQVEEEKQKRIVFMEENKLLQKKSSTKKNHGGGGLWSWIFHWFIPSSSSSSSSSWDTTSDIDDSEDYDDEEEEALLEDLARSTLLDALQTERNNVHELETIISTLQQNNSAIADMVQSRDSLIEELNKRVGVFEDDKMVLKAALRQLQNEIKQEAPKTEKLMMDLTQARQDVQDLELELESLKSLHEQEMDSMNTKLKQKQTVMEETDSKMNMISVYVDQLEERLASFAMARRDIEAREERCKDLEIKIGEHTNEIQLLKTHLESASKERGELKDLVDLLVKERMALEKKKIKLEEEIKDQSVEGESMRAQIHTLTGELSDMKTQISNLTMTLGEIESLNNQNEMELLSLRDLRGNYDSLLQEANELHGKVSSMESEITNLRDEKDIVLLRISDVEFSKRILEDQLSESLTNISFYKAELEGLNKVIADVDPQFPILEVWDPISKVFDESNTVQSLRDNLIALNKPMIQSLAIALYSVQLQNPDQDTVEMVKSMATKKFKNLLSDESATDWIKDLLQIHLHESLNDAHLTSFLMSQTAIRALAMILLTKMVMQLMSGLRASSPFRTDDHFDDMIPPPPPPVIEDFVEDIDLGEYESLESNDLNASIPSHLNVAQSRDDGRNEDNVGFTSDDEEIIKISDVLVSTTKADQEIVSFLADDKSPLETVLLTDGHKGLTFPNDVVEDITIVEPSSSSMNSSCASEHDTVSSVQREVPFRNVRKFLSRKTGLHGLITPPSKRIILPTKRFKNKRP